MNEQIAKDIFNYNEEYEFSRLYKKTHDELYSIYNEDKLDIAIKILFNIIKRQNINTYNLYNLHIFENGKLTVYNNFTIITIIVYIIIEKFIYKTKSDIIVYNKEHNYPTLDSYTINNMSNYFDKSKIRPIIYNICNFIISHRIINNFPDIKIKIPKYNCVVESYLDKIKYSNKKYSIEDIILYYNKCMTVRNNKKYKINYFIIDNVIIPVTVIRDLFGYSNIHPEHVEYVKNFVKNIFDIINSKEFIKKDFYKLNLNTGVII